MIKKWMTHKHDHTKIQEVEVTRETEQSVWTKFGSAKRERREAKVSSWNIYHDTWKDAHEYLKSCNRNDIARYQKMLDNALQESDELQAMTEPTHE